MQNVHGKALLQMRKSFRQWYELGMREESEKVSLSKELHMEEPLTESILRKGWASLRQGNKRMTGK